jgi:hypothetical protein
LPYIIFVSVVLLFSQPTFSEPAPFDVYGGKVGFDVVRDGELVGQHVTTFTHDVSGMVIESRMNMSITFLTIPVYSFDYRSVEKWSGGALSHLDVVIEDGSDHIKISSLPKAEGLKVKTPSGTYYVDTPIISTNHWNVDVVKKSRVLNTLTGNINQVKITNRGEERIPVKGSSVLATRYDYSGELTDTSVWYDAMGRWSKLEFKARDGSTVEYICNTCESEP